MFTEPKSKFELDIRDLTIEYRTEDRIVKAANTIEIQIERGETLGLVGETGAGKTTIALAIMGLIPDPPGVIVEGRIDLDGTNLLNLSEREMEAIRGKHVAMIFQDPMTSLDPLMRIEDQIAESYTIHDKKMPKAEAVEKARDMLRLVGIPEERGREYPHQFSGGMRQRVIIAIAMAGSPNLLIADEPTTALDVTIQAQVLKMMKELQIQYHMSLLMITHDLGVVAEVCDKVSVIYAGHIIEHGSLGDIYEHTRHPYTQGLFNSLPNPEKRNEMLKPIKGLIPDPANLPLGCPFCTRCDYVMEICETIKPPRVFRKPSHYVECHLYSQENITEGALKWT